MRDWLNVISRFGSDTSPHEQLEGPGNIEQQARRIGEARNHYNAFRFGLSIGEIEE
jgi:hypothetical protein